MPIFITSGSTNRLPRLGTWDSSGGRVIISMIILETSIIHIQAFVNSLLFFLFFFSILCFLSLHVKAPRVSSDGPALIIFNRACFLERFASLTVYICIHTYIYIYIYIVLLPF